MTAQEDVVEARPARACSPQTIRSARRQVSFNKEEGEGRGREAANPKKKKNPNTPHDVRSHDLLGNAVAANSPHFKFLILKEEDRRKAPRVRGLAVLSHCPGFAFWKKGSKGRIGEGGGEGLEIQVVGPCF